MKKILVLGGTGAMGVYLVQMLSAEKDMEVLVTSRQKRNEFGCVRYIEGNAHDETFRKTLFNGVYYDVVVDFMNYGCQEFLDCHKLILQSTSHYVFLSSSRVYAQSETPITESSDRLLDVTNDEAFLATQRYALRKARQEDMLRTSGRKNYTIIRPYITYSNRRIQLGIYEKEDWLYRILNDKGVIISDGILDKKTTLTFGEDVSSGIYYIVKHLAPSGESVHITTEENMTWYEILSLYLSVIREEIGKDIKIYTSSSIKSIEEIYEGGYNTIYDRQWNRIFSNGKAEMLCGHVDYVPMRRGLRDCLSSFLRDWKQNGNAVFLPINDAFHAEMDMVLQHSQLLKPVKL